MPTTAPAVVGSWEKVTRSACARRYPDQIEFRAGGSYAGRSDPAGTFAYWDLGSFEIENPGQVKISTANDAVVSYEFSLSGDTLTFRDPEGCQFSYRRVAPPG